MLSVVKLKPKYMHTIRNVVSQKLAIANLRLDSGINGVYGKTISIAISLHLFFFFARVLPQLVSDVFAVDLPYCLC